MQAIANLIVATIDLLELEGRALHRSVLRLVWKLLALIGAAIVALSGAAFVAVAVLLWIAHLIGWPLTLLAVGVVMLGIAFGLYLYARSLPMLRASKANVDPRTAEERALDDAVASARVDQPAGRTEGYHRSGVSGSPSPSAVAGGKPNAASVA